jgi:hypothetical protein
LPFVSARTTLAERGSFLAGKGMFPVAPAIAARFGKADVDRTKRMPSSMNDRSWLPTGHSSGDEHRRALAAPATS